ncbi:Rieske (2Fe-2S) protein [Streptomyces sp. NPDC048603]|uniref:Rieske (2Fe-2S) protein n=1 Tax=Streptomyces sp. NPDC048603 TaxID=3365577 RepID=UPI0037118C84
MEAQNEIRAARADQIPPGGTLPVDLDGTPVLLTRIGETVHAISALCSHEGAPLSDGEVMEDGTIECPWHFSRFCLRTGEALDLPATDPVPAYRARVEGDEVYVRLAPAPGS